MRLINIRYLFLLSLLVISGLMYFPAFSNVVLFERGNNPLSRYLTLLTVLTFVVYFNFQAWKKNRFIIVFFIYALIIGLVGFVLDQADVSSLYRAEAQSIITSFVFFLIGFSSGIKLTYKQIVGLIFIYAIIVGYAVYLQLLQHAGGLVIVDQYIGYGKNTLGVMCASLCIALLIVHLSSKGKNIKIISLVLYFVIFTLTLFLRARSSYIFVLVISLIIVYRQFKSNGSVQKYVLLVIGALLTVIFFIFTDYIEMLFDLIWDSFTRNRDMEDLSSGRIYRNEIGISMIKRNPLFGNLVLQRNMDVDIHNYFLRQLSSFGIIGSLPILLLYLQLMILVVKRFLKTPLNIQALGYGVFFVQIFSSMIEPTFPFGPGTGVLFSYIMLGYSVCQSKLFNSTIC